MITYNWILNHLRSTNQSLVQSKYGYAASNYVGLEKIDLKWNELWLGSLINSKSPGPLVCLWFTYSFIKLSALEIKTFIFVTLLCLSYDFTVLK